MNYELYRQIQSDLGATGDFLRSDLNDIFNSSEADENTKALLKDITNRISKSIDELSLLVSKSLIAASK